MLNIKQRVANKPKVAIAGFGKAGKSWVFIEKGYKYGVVPG